MSVGFACRLNEEYDNASIIPNRLRVLVAVKMRRTEHQGRIHGLKSGGTNHGEREESEERRAKGAEGVGCGEGVSPLYRGRGLYLISVNIFPFFELKWQVLVRSGS